MCTSKNKNEIFQLFSCGCVLLITFVTHDSNASSAKAWWHENTIYALNSEWFQSVIYAVEDSVRACMRLRERERANDIDEQSTLVLRLAHAKRNKTKSRRKPLT